MFLVVEEIVQLEEEDKVVWWNMAGRPVVVRDILHFEQEKEVIGTLGMSDSLDRAKAETYIGKVIASENAVMAVID